MAEEHNEQWKLYIIPDLRTWSAPKEGEQQTPIEYYKTFEEAKARFDELRSQPYNSENALNWRGEPCARLTMGIERKAAAADIIHIRGGENVLVEDFTRSPEIATDSAALALIRRAAAEIGFDKVNYYPKLENGKYGEAQLIAFQSWAAEHSQFNLTGGNTMEQNTKFDVSSISKIENGGSVKALASIVINNEIAVRGVKVVEGENGLNVVMPSRKNGNEYSDVAFPVTKEAHDAIKSAVLSSYDELMKSGEKTLKNDVPTAEQSTSSIKATLHPVNGNQFVKAAGQVTIDKCFVVQDIKVVTAEGKPPFVSMPSYQNSNGEYVQTALPITKDMHEKLDKAVLGAYQTLGKVEYQGVIAIHKNTFTK